MWLRHVGDNDWLTIVRDKRMRYRTTEKAALVRHRVRVVVVATSQNLNIDQTVDLLTSHWHAIEAALVDPPAFYHLTMTGLSKKLDYEP